MVPATPMFEGTISLGAAITIAVDLVMVGGFIWTIKAAVAVLAERLRLQNDAHVNSIADIDNTIRELREETKKLGTVVTELALQNQRMNYMEERMLAQGKRIDELESR